MIGPGLIPTKNTTVGKWLLTQEDPNDDRDHGTTEGAENS